MRATVLALVLAGVPVACVEERDASLDREAPAAAPAAAASREQPPAARLVASLTEWHIALSHPEAAAGAVSIDVENNGAELHALEIQGGGLELRSDPLEPGAAVTMTVVLEPGVYDVYCPLASGGEAHADRGMRTALRVR